MSDDLERRLRSGRRALINVRRLREDLAKRAGDAGLLDVAYGTHDSPLGRLTVFVTPRGLASIAYPDDPIERQLEEVAATISPRVMAAPARTDDVRRQLDEYFAGDRRAFEVPIDWRALHGFREQVLRATARIPFGDVSTYREIATEAGSPNAYRAAGNALGSNPVPIVVPCHRVLHAGGGLGGYTGGIDRKQFLLRLEGVLPR